MHIPLACSFSPPVLSQALHISKQLQDLPIHFITQNFTHINSAPHFFIQQLISLSQTRSLLSYFMLNPYFVPPYFMLEVNMPHCKLSKGTLFHFKKKRLNDIYREILNYKDWKFHQSVSCLWLPYLTFYFVLQIIKNYHLKHYSVTFVVFFSIFT